MQERQSADLQGPNLIHRSSAELGAGDPAVLKVEVHAPAATSRLRR